MNGLDKRIAALEARFGTPGSCRLFLVRFVGVDPNGGPAEEEARRIWTHDCEWTRLEGEAEPDFIARAEREAWPTHRPRLGVLFLAPDLEAAA